MECGWCGTEFTQKRANEKFCSAKCRNKNGNLFKGKSSQADNPEFWAVTEPYGAHKFDWWVKCSLEGGGAVSHV